MTSAEIEKMNNEIKKESEQGFGRWGWFGVIYHLSKGDTTKFDAVCDLELLLVLNTLAYEKEKQAEERKLEQQQQNRK